MTAPAASTSARSALLPLPSSSAMDRMTFTSARRQQRSWVEVHRERLNTAIAFLRASGILCSRVERDSAIPRFRVTGYLNSVSEFDVIALAEKRGFAHD